MDEGTFQGWGVKFSNILRGLLIKVSGRFGGGGGLGKGGEVNISGWGWYPGGHYDYLKVHVYSIFVFPIVRWIEGATRLGWVLSTTCPLKLKPFCVYIKFFCLYWLLQRITFDSKKKVFIKNIIAFFKKNYPCPF